VTKSITLGCTNNVTANVSILPWELTADPTAIVANSAFSVQYGGEAVFSETFLDAGLAAVPGLKKAELIAAVATAHVRSGATGADVALNAEPIPTTCSGGMNAGGACTTAADCPPGAPYVSCGQFVQIPTIPGVPLSAGGCTPVAGSVPNCDCSACNAIGKLAQCQANGYCIAQGGLSIPLQTPTGNYTADASGQVLIGWQDQGTGATIAADGTYNLPAASFPAPVAPNGIRVIAAVLQVALQCTMAVDSGTTPPAPVLSSPTPNSLLIAFDI
jgi:hypothetical protein